MAAGAHRGSSGDERERLRTAKGEWFASTHWSVVLAADGSGSDAAQRALESLCVTYWYPLYAFVRRCGHDTENARDLTQGFFAELLERKALSRVDRGLGRFRSFLLASLQHYLADQRDKAQAQKRGGGRPVLSLDEKDAEGRYQHEPVDDRTPDKLFDRRWALTVMEQAVVRLRAEYAADGRTPAFEHLIEELFGGGTTTSNRDIAALTGATESTVRTWRHRMRQRYGVILRQIVADTVGSPEEVDGEISALIAAVRQ